MVGIENIKHFIGEVVEGYRDRFRPLEETRSYRRLREIIEKEGGMIRVRIDWRNVTYKLGEEGEIQAMERGIGRDQAVKLTRGLIDKTVRRVTARRE